jgi:hypothetical protein
MITKKNELRSIIDSLGDSPINDNSLLGLNTLINNISDSLEAILSGKITEKQEINIIAKYKKRFNDFLSEFSHRYQPSTTIKVRDYLLYRMKIF